MLYFTYMTYSKKNVSNDLIPGLEDEPGFEKLLQHYQDRSHDVHINKLYY